MPKVTPDVLARLQARTSALRNVCVIAHVDHGKSTLSDSLIAGAGLLAAKDVGKVRKTDGRQDEQDRCITIKSTGISLFLDHAALGGDAAAASAAAAQGATDDGFLINLIDCPGHVDFSSEVTAALRLCDGAFVVVDCISGTAVQTRTVLRQSLTEKVKPVLVINKLDRAFGQTQDSSEEFYLRCFKSVTDVNQLIETFQEARKVSALSSGRAVDETDWRVSPTRGEVAFTVALHGWGFTLPQFAEMIMKKGKLAGVDGAESVEALCDKLWGDWYFDAKALKFVQESVSSTTGRRLKRAFCQFVAEPIMTVLRTCGVTAGKVESAPSDEPRTWARIEAMLTQIGAPEQRWPKGREAREALIDGPETELMRAVMQAWLPAHEALLRMAVVHLPSPKDAMVYRCEKLFSGPQDSPMAQGIKNCDPNGPLCVFISKHVPTKDNSRFISFGRVFSGTLTSNAKVCILGPEYEGPTGDGEVVEAGLVKDLIDNVSVQRTVVMMADRTEPSDAFPAGNTVAIFGIDSYVNKTCTLVNAGARKASGGRLWPMNQLKYAVSPVVRVAVACKNPADVGKLSQALQKLSKSDPLVLISADKSTNEHTIACAGELHLEICLNDLRDFLPEGVDINVSEPAVPYQETVTGFGEKCLAKSSNKHNRFWITAEPLPESLVSTLDSGEDGERLRAGIIGSEPAPATADAILKARAQRLHKEFGFDLNDARKIWAFGPEPEGGVADLKRGGTGAMTCMFMDCTKGVQYLHEARDTLIGGFHEVCSAGVLTGEPLRGVLFKLHDALLHADAPHRGPGQIVPAIKRAMHGAQLTAWPKLVEPVFLADVSCSDNGSAVGRVYTLISQKRGGVVIDEIPGVGGSLPTVRAHLPVAESFGFTSALREATGGEAFPQLVFDHWSVMTAMTFAPEGAGGASVASADAIALIQDIRRRKKMAKLTPPEREDLVDKL